MSSINQFIYQTEQKHKQQNEMEVIKQSGKHTDEIWIHILLLSYHDKKGDCVIKPMKNQIKKLFPEAITTKIRQSNCASI